jgi:Zn-dependent peptidase ImmA (M78 family)/transcriptional regulator with XRE-family HTH domain
MARTGDPVVPVGPNDIQLAAHLFHPPRLTLARELRGMTRVELAAKVGKTPAAIGQFEGGGKAACRPDAKTLGLLALALSVPVGFFTRKTPAKSLDIDACHFRSLRSASQRERRRLIARGSLLCDVLRVLEEHVELPAERVSAAAQGVDSEQDIEVCAAAVRRAWGLGLGPIANVVELLEAHGVIVTHIPDTCAAVDAFSTWQEGRPIVFLVMEKGSTSRSRFDAMHELGHLIMHADAVPGSPVLESQANRFASAFLLPRESFLAECPTWLNWDHFYELKRRWRVSVAALIRRARDLGRISDASYRRAYVHLNRTGERQHERDEPPYEPPTLISSALDAVADDISASEVAALVGVHATELEALGARGSVSDDAQEHPS